MSNRSLLEFNHDYAHDIARQPDAFVTAVRRYLASADRDAAEALDRFGIRIVSMRHHADKFFIDEREDGFPAKYINRSERTGA